MAPFGYNQQVKDTLYKTWNGQEEQDWKEHGAGKYYSYLKQGGTQFGDMTTAHRGILGRVQKELAQEERTRFQTKIRGEEDDFLNRFKTEYPELLSTIESELQLPGLRNATFAADQQFEKIPEATQQAARGRDVNANQLQRMITNEMQESIPGLEDMYEKLQFAESEFGRRAQRELTPYKTEMETLSSRWAREASGFNMDMKGQLDMLLNKMNLEGQLSIAEMQNATRLAELEAQKEELQRQFERTELTGINLGDRYGFFNPYTGQEVSGTRIGLGPTRGGGGGSSSDRTGLSYLQPNTNTNRGQRYTPA